MENDEQPLPVLGYASGVPRARPAAGVYDWCYLAIALAAYPLFGYAQIVMPGGVNWSYEWQYASKLMNIAALASAVTFFVGLVRVLWTGWRRCPGPLIFGVWASGLLPLLMLIFGQRWIVLSFG